jgi:hypothetical protein
MNLALFLNAPAAAWGALWVAGMAATFWGGRHLRREMRLLEPEEQALVRLDWIILKGAKYWYFFVPFFVLLFVSWVVFDIAALAMAIAFSYALLVKAGMNGVELNRLRGVDVPGDFRRKFTQFVWASFLGAVVVQAATCVLFWKLEQLVR